MNKLMGTYYLCLTDFIRKNKIGKLRNLIIKQLQSKKKDKF